MTMHSTTAPVGFVPSTSGSPRPGLIDRALSAIASFFNSLAASQKAAHHYERLAMLSDGELRAYGLKREDIPRHVFEQAFDRS